MSGRARRLSAACAGWTLVFGAGCAHRATDPRLPLEPLADAPLPGGATRFDYQDLDPARGLLVIAHMNDGTVLLVDLDGAVKAEIPNVPTARGVAVASELGRVFVTSSPDQVVAIDLDTFTEVSRFSVGRGPDGIAWDPVHAVVGVSAQADGALTLVGDAGQGDRADVPLGDETGNVAWDTARGWFWITVVGGGDDRLVAVDPRTTAVSATLPIPGCSGAHGLRLHPDGASAFVACEGNATLARVPLDGGPVATAGTGAGPDVLALDPGLGFLYVAAEAGDLTVWDTRADGLSRLDKEDPGPNTHTVAVDPASHRVYFPLERGDAGTPVLRILAPRAP